MQLGYGPSQRSVSRLPLSKDKDVKRLQLEVLNRTERERERIERILLWVSWIYVACVAVLQHLNAIAVQLFCLHVAVWDAKRKGASTANKNTGGIREGDFSNVTGVKARQLLPNVWLQYEHPSPRRCKKLWENVNLWSYRSMIKMNVFWMYVHAYKYICMY